MKGAVLFDCVYLMSKQVEATDESSAAVCNIWHVKVNMLPEWILTSVQQVGVPLRKECVCSVFVFGATRALLFITCMLCPVTSPLLLIAHV